MTRILLVSDSHGLWIGMEMMLRRHPEVDYIFHLGDGLADVERLRRHTDKPVLCVTGNCDGFADEPMERQFEADGVRLLLTHGHAYRVKYRLDALAYRAVELGVQAVLFGHTHRQTLLQADGVTLINPGSARSGDYALLTLEAGGVRTRLMRLDSGVDGNGFSR